MRILALSVDDAIANSYYNAPLQEKTIIQSVINLVLEKLLKQNRNAAYFKLMDEVSEETNANGLTPQKLGEIMQWDEETMKNLFGEEFLAHD